MNDDEENMETISFDKDAMGIAATQVARVLIKYTPEFDHLTKQMFRISCLLNLLANLIEQTWDGEEQKDAVMSLSRQLWEGVQVVQKYRAQGDHSNSYNIETGMPWEDML